jgi:peptide/nickel transport system ATP-binding protein
LDASFADRNASSLSGGQCQRANIARALILHPKLVVCDEPVSSLDYSIRKQILQLLKEMQQKYGLTYLFITHDLSNVPYVCQQVAIMYQGQIVELIKQTEQLEEIACHPYTQLLFRSVPAKHPGQRRLLSEQEDQALTENFEKGCNFQNRCKKCTEQCRQHKPVLKEISYGHHVACHCFE